MHVNMHTHTYTHAYCSFSDINFNKHVGVVMNREKREMPGKKDRRKQVDSILNILTLSDYSELFKKTLKKD